MSPKAWTEGVFPLSGEIEDTNCIKKRKNNAMKTVDLFAEN